ncbi:MAG: hypothetical protein AB8B73_09555 [Ekhidna sp.]
MSRIHEDHKENLELKLSYTKDILDKRYALYSWLDTKTNLSLAINSALLGFSYLLLNNHNEVEIIYIKIIILISVLLIGFSILISLSLTNPTMKTPIWKMKKSSLIDKQPRTSIGIALYEPDEYLNHMLTINTTEMITYNSDQIVKMNSNINLASKKLKTIVRLSSIALILLVIAILWNYTHQLLF